MSRNPSFFSASSCQSSVALTVTRVFAGALLQGSTSLNVSRDTPVRNVHIKIVGKEQVHAMADHVAELTTPDVPFGTVSQDYVYYREIVTIAGDLLTRPRRTTSHASQQSAVPNASEAPPGEEEVTYQETHLADNSFVSGAAAGLGNNSVLTSLEAAAAQQHVVLPAGSYTYPFAFALPAELPPSYETGVQVKNGDQSTSRAELRYYVKLYVVGVDGKELDTATCAFCVLPMQPPLPNRTFIGCMQHRLRDEGTCVEVRFPAAGSSCGALCGGGGGSGTKPNSKQQLAVRMALKPNWVTLNEDRLEVKLTMHNKTAKAIQGARLTLVQQLTFHTAKATVVTSRNLLSAESRETIACGQQGTITVASDSAVASGADVMPTLSTSGLTVQYNVRVDLVAGHIVSGTYTFEGVVLAGGADPDLGEPPCGELSFAALPRGHLTRREAYYAVPQKPCVPPQLAQLRVTSAS